MSANMDMSKIQSKTVDARISKVLEMRTDSAAMIESLDAISDFYTSNTIEARRSLRQSLEYQNLRLAQSFLNEFDSIKDNVENLERLSNNLQSSCSNIASHVSKADENMKLFMEKASELEQKGNYYSDQSKEIASFLSKFQLSSTEIDTLHNPPLDDSAGARQFFEIITRLAQAYTECKAMVEKHCYSAGFELLDVLGQHQDVAYQKLFDWVKRECELVADNAATTADEVDITLQMAIKALRQLPIYFAQCEDLVVNSRRSQLVQKFIVALTQGGGSGHIFRAIDLLSHDANRYIGDMLAWMHQVIASEEEFLEAVFGNAAQNSQPSMNDHEDGEKNDDSVPMTLSSTHDLLARCLQGLGRPLRVRIMQTLESNSSLEMLYLLADLLRFYESTFASIIKVENAVHSAVKGCLLECQRMFSTALKKQAKSLQENPPAYPLDLTASHMTRECGRQIREIMKVSEQALSLSNADGGDDEIFSLNNVIGGIIQPILQACRVSGQQLGRSDTAVFMLNNVAIITHELSDYIQRSRSSHESMTTWLSNLNVEESTWIDVIVREESSKALSRSGIDKLLELIESLPADLCGSQQVGLGQDRINTVMRSFYSSLFSTMTPQFDKLKTPQMREKARRGTSASIAHAHAVAHNMIMKKENGYDVSVLTHSIEEVNVLLNVNM